MKIRGVSALATCAVVFYRGGVCVYVLLATQQSSSVVERFVFRSKNKNVKQLRLFKSNNTKQCANFRGMPVCQANKSTVE